MIAPPFVITEDEIGELIRRLTRALEHAARATKAVEAV